MQPQQKSPRWHILYYILAAFDVVTIGFSLSLNHQILGIYNESIAVHTQWVERSDQYEEISKLAGQVNAPGNDIFDSQDVGKERARKTASLAAYNLAFSTAKTALMRIPNAGEQSTLTAQFVKIEKSMAEMDAEAEVIFNFFSKGDATGAGTRMATMDRRYNDLNQNLSTLRGLVRNYQKDNLQFQESAAKGLSRYEVVIAGIILLIVCLVAFYGHWLNSKLKETNDTIMAQKLAIENSARLASLGTMSAGVAHEINNPLAILQGNAEFIKLELEKHESDPAILKKRIGTVLAMNHRIATIVKGLLTFSRDTALDEYSEVSVTHIIQDSVTLCGARFRNNEVDLRIRLPDGDLMVGGKAAPLCQVLVNLISNAFDAVSATAGSWVEISSLQSGDQVKILVKDSGNGIPVAIAEKMMTPFFTTKDVGKGTGLGLSISHGIIEQHGGRIYVDHSSTNTLIVVELAAWSRNRQFVTKEAG